MKRYVALGSSMAAGPGISLRAIRAYGWPGARSATTRTWWPTW